MFNSPFSMVVAIVFIAGLFGLIRHYIDSRAAQPNVGNGPDDETRQIILKLEHRVQVLERIVTDGGYNLKKEIDSL